MGDNNFFKPKLVTPDHDPLKRLLGYGFIKATDELDDQNETALLRVGEIEKMGKGLFAKVDITKKKRIFGATGKEYLLRKGLDSKYDPTIEFIALGPNASMPNAICINEEYDPETQELSYRWLNPDDSNPLRVINHSCNPNTARLGPYAFFSRRDIGMGEQITADYSTLEINPEWNMPCHCGEPNCRKIIGGVQTLPLAVAQEYWSEMPRFMQKLYVESLAGKSFDQGDQDVIKNLKIEMFKNLL